MLEVWGQAALPSLHLVSYGASKAENIFSEGSKSQFRPWRVEDDIRSGPKRILEVTPAALPQS